MKPLKTIGLSLALSSALALPALAQHGHYNRGGPAEAIVYAGPNFTGQSLRVTGAIPRLGDYRFNDKVSSIRVTGGAWEVCTDGNFRGRCEVITFQEGRLNEFRLNDKITSIRPAAYGGGYGRRDDDWGRGRDRDWDRDDRRYGYGNSYNAPVVLFQHPDFRGDALPLNGAVAHLNQLRFNDKVSSIAIQSGAWEVCTDPNFRGRCEVINTSASELGYYRLNDNITSIRPAGYGHGRRW